LGNNLILLSGSMISEELRIPEDTFIDVRMFSQLLLSNKFTFISNEVFNNESGITGVLICKLKIPVSLG